MQNALDRLADTLHPWDLRLTLDGREYVTRPLTLGALAAIAGVRNGVGGTVADEALSAVVAGMFDEPRPQVRTVAQAVAIVRAVLAYLGVLSEAYDDDGEPVLADDGGAGSKRQTIPEMIAALCMAYPALHPDDVAGMRIDVACLLLAGRVRLMRHIAAHPGGGEGGGRFAQDSGGIDRQNARPGPGGTTIVPVRGLDGLRAFLQSTNK